MTSTDYRAEFRDAQAAFRARRYAAAYLAAQSLLERNPDSVDIANFRNAVAKSVNAQLLRSIREERLDETLELAKLLIDHETFALAARDALIKATRVSLDSGRRAELLLGLSERDGAPDAAVWAEIAECIRNVPATDHWIEIGFRALEILPGHKVAVAGLTDLIDMHEKMLQPSEATSTTNSALVDIIAKRTRPDMSYADRCDLYGQIRQDAPGQGLLPHRPTYRQRLELECAFEAIEAGYAPKPKPENAEPTAFDAWELVNPNSTAYVLGADVDSRHEAARALPERSTTRSFWLLRVLSLWLQSTNREASQDRIGYLWLILDPMIHVLIICAVPFFIHDGDVEDMPVLAFGVIGACFWMVFRVSSIGALSGGGVLVPQLEHPMVARLDIMCARAVNALIIYTFIGTLLLGAIILLGLGRPPMNFLGFVMCLMLAWLMGMSYGAITNALIGFYPGFRRINGFVLRFFGLTSGLFYVTEQLPESIAQFILINPLLHNVQFARSYWFAEYQTQDASADYLFFAVITLLVLALIATLRQERQPDTVRA